MFLGIAPPGRHRRRRRRRRRHHRALRAAPQKTTLPLFILFVLLLCACACDLLIFSQVSRHVARVDAAAPAAATTVHSVQRRTAQGARQRAHAGGAVLRVRLARRTPAQLLRVRTTAARTRHEHRRYGFNLYKIFSPQGLRVKGALQLLSKRHK